MLFKISNEKEDQKCLGPQENSLTFFKTHIPGLNSKVGERSTGTLPASKWAPCLLSTLILMVLLFLTLSVLFYMNVFNLNSSKALEVGVCHYKHKTGSCMAQDYCCNGEYAIGKNICTGTQFCCMGNQKANRSDFWSFESLTQISSQVIYRNVSESIVEQTIVISLSAIEEVQYFHEMSEKINKDMSAATQQMWFSAVGNKDSFDLNFNQFSAFILITINEIEVFLFRITQNMIPQQSPDYSASYELHENNMAWQSHLDDHDYELDARPTFEIIRNELNASMQEFAIQTIDYVINSCLNSYKCITSKIVATLNQQFKSTGGEWQTIITSNTITDQMNVDVNYLHGFLLDGIFNNRHRILIYKTENGKMSELEIIQSGRIALTMNKTIIIDNSFALKANETQNMVIKDIRRAVMSNDKLLSICCDLTSVANKFTQNWGCVAGPQHSFSYNMRTESSKHYLIIKLNELLIILFKKSCNKRFRV